MARHTVLLLNAYSADNHGDGLLVSLSDALLREALGTDIDVTVVAGHPGSFTDHRAIAPFRGRSRAARALAGAATFVAPRRLARWAMTPELTARAANDPLLVSVGGGYLRGESLSAVIKSSAVHLAQLRWAAASGQPWIVLPQSIGPYPGVLWPLVRRTLSCADAVFVRDDRSLAQLRTPTTHRAPDLAVAEIAHQFFVAERPPRQTRCGRIGLVLRALPRARDYEQRVQELRDAIDEPVACVQSVVGGNDDRPFVTSVFGSRPTVRHDTFLADPTAGVTVSVRLHGALESLLAGVPAIHLSYERKGFGAYEDLGLERWLHQARDFDPQHVARQAADLRNDPAPFWAALRAREPALTSSRRELLRTLTASLRQASRS